MPHSEPAQPRAATQSPDATPLVVANVVILACAVGLAVLRPGWPALTVLLCAAGLTLGNLGRSVLLGRHTAVARTIRALSWTALASTLLVAVGGIVFQFPAGI